MFKMCVTNIVPILYNPENEPSILRTSMAPAYISLDFSPLYNLLEYILTIFILFCSPT